MASLGQGIKILLNAGQGRSLEDPLAYTHQVLYGGSPIPFLITESLKIIWHFHTSREVQNKISRSRISQNSNSHLRKIGLYHESRKNKILNHASRKKYRGPSITSWDKKIMYRSDPS